MSVRRAIFGRRIVLPDGARRRALRLLVVAEAKLAWRQPVGLVYGLGFPLLLLVIFASIPKFREVNDALGGLSLLEVYVPVLIVFGLAMLSLAGMSTVLAGYREQGVLRRLSTTPVQPSWVLAAQLAVDLAIATASVLLIMAVSVTAFGVGGPVDAAGFVLSVALTSVALFAMGLLVAAIAPSAQAAGAIGSAFFFPMMFFAGLWIPRDVMPAILSDVGDYTPLGAAVDAIQSAMFEGFPSASTLLVLAGYGLAFWLLAVRSFRWE